MKRSARIALWLGGVATATAAVIVTSAIFERRYDKSSEAAIGLQLAGAQAYADSLERTLRQSTAPTLPVSDALAALYLERLRLGLGSPFRVIDQVLRDPAFEPEHRRRLAEALLARTLAGSAYQVEAAALDLIDADPESRTRPRGTRHQSLINSVIANSRDPREGELTVRLAYRLAAASGAVARRAPEIAANAAAQVRDRILARRDAKALVDAAAEVGGDPLALLSAWRDERRLEVERPVIVPLSQREERSAVEALPSVVARLESLSAEDLPPTADADVSVAVAGTREVSVASSRPGEALALHMVRVAQSRDGPPQAPVSVSVVGYAPLIERLGTPLWERAWRARFVSGARNEETLAAEYALLLARSRHRIGEASVAVLTAGAALRTYAQEHAWLAGDLAPTVRETHARFGVTVTFDAAVRTAWRPYLLRSLSLALTDFRRVLPDYDARGLRVHFGESPLRDRALALHAPAKRMIYFPAGTSAGVMAHEFAHDLDWLAARRYYGGTGWYRTDRAVRQASDHLATTLRQMASAARIDTGRGGPGGTSRPTEVFARNVDWFVSAALAREGRLNGYLSAVQDPVLTGYASATTPEAAQDAGSATLRALDEVTLVPQEVRLWFSSLFGVDRRVSVHEAVRQVLEAPLSSADVRAQSPHAFWAPEATGSLFRGAPAASGAWTCLVGSFTDRSSDAGAARAVIQFAAEARARGMVRQWSAFARRFPAWSSWRLRALTGEPWAPAIADELSRELRDVILWRALAGRTRDATADALGTASGRRVLGCADR